MDYERIKTFSNFDVIVVGLVNSSLAASVLVKGKLEKKFWIEVSIIY